jgi:hypothetical protein
MSYLHPYILKTEAAHCSERPVTIYQTTRYHIPEDIHRQERDISVGKVTGCWLNYRGSSDGIEADYFL